MINKINLKIKVNDITTICYGICVFVFVIGQSYLPASFAVLSMLCKGLRFVAVAVPALLFLKNSKFSIRNLVMWGLIALLIIGNIFFNQADSDLIYIVIFMLYCSKSKPEDVIKTFCISAFVGIVLVIAAWFIGAIPSEVKDGRACLGFYFATFGPNLFLHTVLAYIASRKNRIKLSRWILIEIVNVWFYKMTDTLAVFVIINIGIVLYYVFNIEKVKQVLFEGKVFKYILALFPFANAAITILAQYFYIEHYNEPMYVAANVALSNRLYFGKIAIETYGISLFGQPITWLTGTDGTKVSGMDYFYVDSSYLQVLVRYGIIMLIVLCAAMMVVQCYSILTRNTYMCLGCSLFLIHCITDPQLLSFRYNPFIIVFITCVGIMNSQRKIEKQGEGIL